VERHRFREAVMRSQARLTYDEVQAAVIDRRAVARRKLGALLGHLDALHDVYRALRRARERRGALDLDTVETNVVFDARGRVKVVEPRRRSEAHRIIEECMVAANVAAAGYAAESHRPFLYRIHEPPPSDKVNELRVFLAGMGLELAGGDRPKPTHYAQLIARLGESSESRLIQGVLLRSLSQAAYQAKNVGHFGLALDHYAHFTSPIRRYPDLLLHRAIRHALSGAAAGAFAHSGGEMEGLGNHCSLTERRADEATRDVLAWLKCEYMQDKVGEEFDSLVSNVTSFGVFVLVESLVIDGLVHVTALGSEYFHFDPRRMQLVGERTGTTFKLGDRLRVRLLRVDIDERKIDFELVDAHRAGYRRSRLRRAADRSRRTGARRGR
jgi:ribonuclease R